MAAPDPPSLAVVSSTATTVTVRWTLNGDGGNPIQFINFYSGYPTSYPFRGSLAGSPLASTGTYTYTGLTPDVEVTLLALVGTNYGYSDLTEIHYTPSSNPGGGGGGGAGSGPVGLCYTLTDGWISIDGYVLANPAFFCFDLWELLLGPELRGDNSPQPLYPGVYPNRMRATQTDYDIPILIAGECDRFGNRYAEGSTVGFERNIRWFRQTILDPIDTGQAENTRWLVFHTPDGLNLEGRVQPLRLIRGQMVDGADLLTGSQGLAMRGVLRLRFPGGAPQ